MKTNEDVIDNENTHEDDIRLDNVFPIFVDQSLLPIAFKLKRDFYYAIENEVFYDEEFVDKKEHVQFKLFARKRCDDNLSFSSLEVKEEAASITEIHDDVSVRYTDTGVIINQRMYLTNMQWNTIIEVSDFWHQCFVCDNVFEDVKEHLSLDIHMQQLDEHKPFLLNGCVVRSVGFNLHCSVCNVIITVDDSKHFTLKAHKQNLQKAVDGIGIFNTTRNTPIIKKGSYDGNINSIGDGPSQLYSDATKSQPTFGMEFGARKAGNKAQVNTGNQAVTVGSSVEMDSIWGGLTREFGSNDESKIYNSSIQSYSEVTKTNLLPSFVDIQFGSRKVRVKFDHWHMIKDTPSHFICMACKAYYRQREKVVHCNTIEHLSRLRSFKILDYPNGLIRQMEGTTYHCHCCNDLYQSIDINSHLANRYPREAKNAFPITQETRNSHATTSRSEGARSISDVKVIDNNIAQASYGINASQIFRAHEIPTSDMNFIKAYLATIYPFKLYGHILYLPLSHIHVICIREQDYFCGLCNHVSTENIVYHLNSPFHSNLWSSTPFMMIYSYNGIRAIRDALHCVICNMPIASAYISQHLDDIYHKKLLFQSTGYQKKSSENPKSLNKPKSEELAAIKDNEKSILDWDAYLYVNLNKFYKISYYSYHCLTAFGDGTVYCLLCLTRVMLQDVQKHISELKHVEQLNETKFLDGYRGLFRLIKTRVHCATCNVHIAGQDLDKHISWDTHILVATNSQPDKKIRRKNLKRGVEKIDATSVKLEKIYIKEPTYEVLGKISIGKTKLVFEIEDFDDSSRTDVPPLNELSHSEDTTPPTPKAEDREYVILFLNKAPMKVSFENWHGIVSNKNGSRCILCHQQIEDIDAHIANKKHRRAVKKPMVNNYSRHLLRLMENNMLHCIICNTELSIQPHVVNAHIKGTKHKKLFEAIKEKVQD